MTAGLRDVRLVPAALLAWSAAAALVGLRGADAVAPLIAVAAWSAAAGCGAIAIAIGARAALPAVAVAAAAVAWPATTVALDGGLRYDAVPAWTELAEPLRARFRELAAGMPGDGGDLLPGLAIGDEDLVGEPLGEAMRVTALSHLTAVSGANCALVVGLVMVGGALLGVSRALRILLALAALSAFVVLVTPQPSVVRAAVMAAFALGGLAAARPMRGLPLLCVAIVGIVGTVPAAATELGFLLSALATAGLLVLSGPLGALGARVLPAPLATALAVPVAAQLAVQPAIALVQPELPTYGVVANLLAVPAAPVATVLGMLACLVAPALPDVALGIAWLGWLPSQWIASVATTLAELPAARLPWPIGAAGILLHLAVLAAVATALLGRGRRRAVAVALLLVGVAGYTGALVGGRAADAASRPAHWSIAMCEVGQGDAAVVRRPGAVALVDAGPDPTALRACLDELGVDRIDLLVITHFDRDHVGGMNAVLGRVGTVLSGPADPASADLVLGPLAAGGAEVVMGRAGDHGTLGGAPWRVLWPPARGAPAPGNDSSLVWRIDSAGAGSDLTASPSSVDGDGAPMPSAVFLGDLGAVAQARLLGRGVGGPADVVKASHHGSADQHPALYKALAPRVALIGVGRDNDYGHPTDRALDLLRGLGAVVGRTDTDGALYVTTGPTGEPSLWRSRAAVPGAK